MKLTVTAVLCITLLLVDANFSPATKTKAGGGLLKIFKKPAKTKPTKPKQPTQHNQGNYPQQPAGGYPQYPGQHGGYPNQGGYPQQPAGGYPQYPGRPGSYPNQGGYPQYPGRPGGYPNQGGYPQQPAGGYPQYPGRPGSYPNQGGYPQYPGRPGGYPNQGGYPQQPAGGYPQYPGRPGGYPNQGGYPQYPAYPAGSYPAQGHGYGGYGNYPGSYINHNPNNKILSPHYGGSFGFGGYGGAGGSPFSHSVQAMGYAPSSKSKGFGRSAVMAAAGGAMAGMALGYGLGRFPRPHFHFHNPQEEYYYNYYMYRKYGLKSNDKNDYSRDYQYNQPPEVFDKFMESCLKRTDLLPGEIQKPKAAKITIASVNTTTTSIGINTSSGAKAGSFSTASPSTPEHFNISEVNATTPSPPRTLRPDNDDDTVSIVEIGYPALIKQMKVKRCTELFIVYADRHLKKKTQPTVHQNKPLNKDFNTTPNNGIQGLRMGLLSVLITTLMLMNSNMLILLN